MTGQSHDWRGSTAPSLADIESLAAEAYARLPERFRTLCEDLVIRVEDFPTEEVLDTMRPRANSTCSACFRASACRSNRTRPRSTCPT